MSFIKYILLTIVLSSSTHKCNAKFDEKRLLIITIDGLGNDMLSKFSLPHISSLLLKGTHPRTFLNQYPTKTMPNLFSIATGMYVENHGVVGTQLYDPSLKKILNSSSSEFFQQKKNIKPLWILNEEQGGVSACLQWAGCEYAYNGVRPSYFLPYSPIFTFDSLIDFALKLFNPKIAVREGSQQTTTQDPKIDSTHDYTTPVPSANVHDIYNDTHFSPEYVMKLTMKNSNETKAIVDNPANLVMMYFPEPDQTGHLHGIHSEEFKRVLEKIDLGIGYLIEQINDSGLTDVVDIIILSDHGMMDIDPNNVIHFSPDVHKDSFKVVDFSPVVQVIPTINNGENIIELFRLLSKESVSKNFEVVTKLDLPASYHYAHNDRIAAIILQANPGYVFEDFEMFMKKNPQANANMSYGFHGYSWNESNAMLPFLVAVGPSFKENVEVPLASNIDVFPLACSILGLTSLPVDGNIESVRLMLHSRIVLSVVYGYILALCAVLSMIGIIGAVYCRYVRHQNRHTRLRNDPTALISGYVYSATNNPHHSMPRPSAIMSSEDEEEEERLLSREEEWEV